MPMTYTVLVVDDDETFLKASRDGLSSGTPSYEVVVANSVDRAIAALDAHDINIVITDIKMPDKDGYELLAHLMENRPDVPAIVLSAYASSKAVKKASDLGAAQVIKKPTEAVGGRYSAAVVAKPVDYDELKEQIEKVLQPLSAGSRLQGVSPAGVMQLVELERTTCVIFFAYDNRKGSITAVNGRVRDARTGNLRGQEAILEMLDWPSPHLTFGKLRWDPEHAQGAVDLAFQEILLEHTRRHDERIQQTTPPGAMPGYPGQPGMAPGGAAQQQYPPQQQYAPQGQPQQYPPQQAPGQQYAPQGQQYPPQQQQYAPQGQPQQYPPQGQQQQQTPQFPGPPPTQQPAPAAGWGYAGQPPQQAPAQPAAPQPPAGAQASPPAGTQSQPAAAAAPTSAAASPSQAKQEFVGSAAPTSQPAAPPSGQQAAPAAAPSEAAQPPQPGTGEDVDAMQRELEELRRNNEILRAASAYYAEHGGPPKQ